MIFLQSLDPGGLFHNRPCRPIHVGEQGKIGVGCCALRTFPGGFHRFPTIEIEFDNGVPSGMLALGIGANVILPVFPQTGKSLRQRRMNLLQVAAKLRRSEIGAAVKDDHELEHGSFTPPGLVSVSLTDPTAYAVGCSLTPLYGCARQAVSIKPATSSARRGNSEMTMCSCGA